MPPRASLALLLSSALLLTGCGADAEPEPKFEAKPSATPTVVPEEVVEEIIQDWAKTDHFMQSTGETTMYRMSTLGCESCLDLAERVEKIYADGGFIKTDGGTIDSIEALDDNQHLVLVDHAPITYREARDAPEKKLPASTLKYVMTVEISASGRSYSLTNMSKQSE